MPMKEKKKKENRVRLGGGGPYVEMKTRDNVKILSKKKDTSEGKIIDMAVNLLVKAELK